MRVYVVWYFDVCSSILGIWHRNFYGSSQAAHSAQRKLRKYGFEVTDEPMGEEGEMTRVTSMSINCHLLGIVGALNDADPNV